MTAGAKPPGKRQAMREAKHLAAGEIIRYLDVGQPNDDHGCEHPCPGCSAVREALIELSERLEAESKIKTYSGGHWYERAKAKRNG